MEHRTVSKKLQPGLDLEGRQDDHLSLNNSWVGRAETGPVARTEELKGKEVLAHSS